MKSESGISYDNAAVASCPKHLLQFAVDQRYDDYTSVDHAVWRFIMFSASESVAVCNRWAA